MFDKIDLNTTPEPDPQGRSMRAQARPPEGVRLTTVREKLDSYVFDPHFRDGCDDVRAIADSGGEVDLWNGSFLVFRPDAIVTRSVWGAVEVLLENGFSILRTYEFQYSHLTVRECWRYQNNVNTRDRLALMDLLMGSTPSLLFLLRAERDGDLPASARLKLLKGPSAPEKRRPGQLRYEMGSVQAPMYSLVHAPDEPADLLRELGIFLEPVRRAQAYGALAGDVDPMSREEVQAVIADIYARTPAHDLTTKTVLGALRERGRTPASLLDDIERGAALALGETLERLRADPEFGPLDAVAIAARIGQGHVPGQAPVLPDSNPHDWRSEVSAAIVGGQVTV